MLQHQNPYLIIRNRYAEFHRVELKIADFILNNGDQVLAMTVAQIAGKLDIAESSIIRFSKIMGYSGFSELKLNLAGHTSPSEETIFQNLDSSDGMAAVTGKVFAANIDILKNTLNMLDFGKMEEAVELLDRADKILFLGTGTSATIAHDFYYRFMRIGFPAQAATDAHMGAVASNLADESCVVVAVSHKGRTRETLDNVRIAKNRGARIIAVTSFLKSPLADISDIVLCISPGEAEMLNEAVSSRVAHITVLDSLYSGIALRRREKVLPMIAELNNLINSHRE